MPMCKSYEEMLVAYQQLYPEIFSGNYVFGTSNNMIQVMSKLPNTQTDENLAIKLPYYKANVLKFELDLINSSQNKKSMILIGKVKI
jgi:hypothetical protein